MHIRRKQSSNRDWKALNCLTKGSNIHKVKLESSEIESIITNSNGIAEMVKRAKVRFGKIG